MAIASFFIFLAKHKIHTQTKINSDTLQQQQAIKK